MAFCDSPETLADLAAVSFSSIQEEARALNAEAAEAVARAEIAATRLARQASEDALHNQRCFAEQAARLAAARVDVHYSRAEHDLRRLALLCLSLSPLSRRRYLSLSLSPSRVGP